MKALDPVVRSLDARIDSLWGAVREARTHDEDLERRVKELEAETGKLAEVILQLSVRLNKHTRTTMPDPPSRAQQLIDRIETCDPDPGSLLFDLLTYLREQEADR